ncbi:conserved Plasmodium protein, unknown function [Plasmodium berghei]|uniref:CRAL/TRIO domain-containing protein, putative n=2 Tax=Plasmodium berghei TaxID=5821 RepID=A0A509AHJ9_PLABA|nr:CRAL/TRIO domain-containing protein, putative [Plasmodium berghei ANKA]CXI33701.1 conserved Plasmodium protein, unknown function [Plasmodium berghei]SCM21292.1 conserved Plasmodium protein, unknown function [Plasmodium berghei]SCN24576.1 conserved Plasmodium protein, unknown function [Plasmodium berghei]SCO59743.1 conserved Plasmodium protein, unknown function [Plasmodium berghei]SCO60979.1 conserved Plasmodium protein, unknown function [Plasmodium berghei]|eukprot:XP_034421188.1 CRAL/TRIO domain-containing protein, putative [Plasmodium berghei ANKA]
MSDNESFASIEIVNDDHFKGMQNNENLDQFLDYDINCIKETDKYKYIGPDIIQRKDLFQINLGQIQFINQKNVKYHNIILNNKHNEADIFINIKKELFNIAYKNHCNKIKGITASGDINQIKDKNEKIKNDNENKKAYDLSNNDFSSVFSNKIEDTYNDIKSSVNWLGNFFSNSEQSNEKEKINIFYSDLYFLNDITILRFLNTYNYNIIKTLNKLIKFILWRQLTITSFNNNNIHKGAKFSTASKKKLSKMSRKIEENSNKIMSNNNYSNSVFINPENIKEILLKTNIFRCGFDKKSRPMLYIKIQEKLNMKEDELFLLLVYHVDMCMNSVDYKKCYKTEKSNTNDITYDNKNEFDETTLQLVIVVDCLNFELNNMISIDCIKKIINIFNEFYTDILYRIYIINIPTFFKKVWSLFNMFIDNHTLKKIIFINKKNINLMYDHIDTNVMKNFDNNFENNHSEHESLIFFPSNSLYYKYDESYFKNLFSYVNIWVENMIILNH